jgi:MATE family multidrug resistance protein
MTLIAGRIGGAETAAWAIVINVAAIIFMVPLGLSSATAVLVGRVYGAQDREGVWRAGVVGLAVVAALTLAIALVIWPTAPWVVSAYSRDAALIAIAVPALVLAALFFVADGVQVVAAQALRAAGDVWWPTAMHIVSYGLVMIPLGWIFALTWGLGVDGIVCSVIVASLTSAALLGGRFRRVARRI